MISGDVLGPEETAEESTLASLRPRLLSEYIGQETVVQKLAITIKAALGRGEPLDHILFHGPPGLGKTTLAHIVSNEMNAGLVCSSGPALERAADLVGILTNLQQGDVLFIDEIHRLPRIVEEYLYPAMEDFQIDIVLDPGPHARTVRLDLSEFTVIGATTRAGLITGPLRNRFGLSLHMQFYKTNELAEIIRRSAGILKLSITSGGAETIALRSRGTPRICNRLLKRVRDFAQVEGRETVTEDVAVEAMDIHGVDEAGLDGLDRKYLRVIIDQYAGGPVGVAALAATLNEEQDTLIDVVEPYLLISGFLNRTSRGRMSTAKACRHLGLRPTGQEELPL
ncbi:MAG: Holliday junction branch migration DNA helicase RuvB [Candidatus Fermentibacteraceae bacterium]|nr:Holliday junction branch migration DNA helicase RuvB [Candidatus Fermentibacteraceae bacterium]MBN2607941.1 Holliday junction branch migration DNA helicase RuvB [Candidatus Fermentibacteraceae bacterium]